MQEENTQTAVPDSSAPDAADIRAGVNLSQKWRFLRARACCTGAVIALVLMLSAGVSALAVQAMQPVYVVFDMKGTLDTFRQQTAQSSLTKEALEAMTKRFGAALDTSLTGWQAKHGGIILVKGAVVAGAVDITPEIQADIARQMQGAP
jgi:conjugal transfer pilin signal peptidase TrbI